jgi:nucleoside-diphosphate-sugar epimerase
MLRRRDYLVVGGSGFIGSHLLKRIQADNLDLVEGHDVKNGIGKRYDVIVFLACNQKDTREAYIDNMEMYEELYHYVSHYPRTRIVYISSAAVYYGGNWYSESKRLGEEYMGWLPNAVVLRLSNVFGHGDGHGAPDRFLRGEKVIHGDGEQVRDLIPVEQVVFAITAMMFNRQRGIFNVSSGVGTTVNEMFKMFGKGRPIHNKSRDGGIRESILPPGRVEL